MTVASVFKEMGYEVTLIDLNKDRIPEADLYGISITTPDFPESIKIGDEIKQQNPDAKVIAGGPHATICPEECAKHFDVVCVGDCSAVENLNGKKIVHGYLKDFDRYHPDRDVVDLWNYEFYVCGERATTTVTAQSCIFRRCAFCSRLPMPYDRVRLHSVKWVQEELAGIAEKGFRAVVFYDDEFLCFRKRDEQIVKLIPEYGFEVWRCFLRADYCLRNKDLVRLAVKNGLREVLIGVESGSAEVLKSIEKGTTPELNLEAIKFLHSLGVKVKASMIVGLPNESNETLKETWRWCEKAEVYVSEWDFTIFMPYPGSKVWRNPARYGIEFDKNEIIYGGGWYKGIPGKYECKIKHPNLSKKEILRWRGLFEKRFK